MFARLPLARLCALIAVLMVGGCGDDTAGVGPDGSGGTGGTGGRDGMAGSGGSGSGGSGGTAGIDGGGTGGTGGAGGTGGTDGGGDGGADATVDASVDAPTPDAEPDAYMPRCGDGIWDSAAGERCDTGIAAGMPGACPTSCAQPSDPCARTTLANPGTCQAECQTTTIMSFINNDGCCPMLSGASYALDTDCPPVCGNGFVEPGEACDTMIASGAAGACPVSCDDSEACTSDLLEQGGTCLAHCTHTPVTTIGPMDGCCPTGGTPANDPDCQPGCGNGTLDAGELCDTAIAAGQTGACPTTCMPQGVCFDAALLSAGTCQAHCQQTPVGGRSCSDANVCNGAEICDSSGVCQPGTPLSCGDGNPCTTDSCDASQGCQHVNRTGPGIVGCDDGNACNGAEQCVVGASGVASCQAGSAPNCNDGNLCTDDSCNPASGCVHTPAPGRACPDGDLCNGNEICDASGVCQRGTVLVCDDGNRCTIDSCSPATGCVFTNAPLGTSCSDGNACNGVETCNDAGACTGGIAPNCNDNNLCTADSCNPAATGDPCVHSILPSGTACDDNSVCNGHETCNATGVCQPGSTVNCDDNNSCTADLCDPVLGCQHMPRTGAACTPSNACASSGMCDANGQCIAMGAMVCNDNNPCTADSCDPSAGCTFVNVANGTSCSSDPCAPATCMGGTCTAGTPPNCNDGNVCTVDSCLAGVGCAHNAAAADGTSCSNDFCNPASCSGGSCVAGAPPSCDDSNLCTVDGCASGQCFHNPRPLGSSCDDGTICNGRETCNVIGNCQPGTPLNCNDGNPCTTDSCDAALGCQHATLPNGSTPAGCLDANACNGIESCQSGVCTLGTPPSDCGSCQSCVSTSPTTHTCGPRDQDGDGRPDCACVSNPTTITCPNGSTVRNCDCNDNDATVFPCAPESCDGKDNNCNGTIDEGFRSYRQPCSSASQCCSGVCAPDALGALRCGVGPSQCKPADDTCQSSSQCCSGSCATDPGGVMICAATGGCRAEGASCTQAGDCCSLYCSPAGLCATGQLCRPQGQSCLSNRECCDNNCVGGSCQPTQSGGCATIGEVCSSGGTCCSDDCVAGRCYFHAPCHAAGDLCNASSDCCDSHCNPTTHRCDTLGACQPSGEPCSISGSRNCCSNLCVYNGIGTGVCQTLNGCAPDGEICNTGNDCCSFMCGSPDALGLRRCENPPGCQPAGEVCGGQGATQNCCCPSGQTCCRNTITGVERCFAEPFGACIPSSCSSANQCAIGFACTRDNQCPNGQTCNTSAGHCTWGGCIAGQNTCPCRFDDECCSRQCVPNPSSPTGFACSATCLPAGGQCRADSDCCSGACVNGTCAAPPDGGPPCVPIGGPCSVTSQCCFGSCVAGTCQLGGGF